MDCEQFPFRTLRSSSKAKEVHISLLTIHFRPEATNFWLLPRIDTFYQILSIEFARLFLSSFIFLEANQDVWTKILFKHWDTSEPILVVKGKLSYWRMYTGFKLNMHYVPTRQRGRLSWQEFLQSWQISQLYKLLLTLASQWNMKLL